MAAPGGSAVPGENPQSFKLVLVGEQAVGKTSLVSRFVRGEFRDHYESTIGAAFMTHRVHLDDVTVKFEIWDTAGQERYHSLAPMYYRGAQAAIVVYDITENHSFLRARTWVQELQRFAKPNIVIALAGNKADLAANRAVEFEEAERYADENGLIFMETSAKSDMNVDDIFRELAKKVPKSSGSQRPGSSREPYVSGHTNQPRQGGSCCKR